MEEFVFVFVLFWGFAAKKKYAPVIVADEQGAKNAIRFYCGKIPAWAGLMQQAKQGIWNQTLCF